MTIDNTTDNSSTTKQHDDQQDDQLQDQHQDEQQPDEQQDGEQDAQVLIGDQIIPIVPIIPIVAQDDNEDDSVYFSMAASLLPPPFHGNYGSDPQNWIETVKWYILTQRAPTEKSKIAIVGVLLQGEAHRWFLSLDIRDPAPDPAPEGFVAYPQDTITNFEQFRVRFLDRFRRDQAELWREQSMLMNLKQRPGQKTETYLEELQQAATSANVAPEQVMLYALSGLRKDVKLFCMNHELATINDVKRWGNVYDLCSEEKCVEANSTIDRLEKAIEKLQVRAISPSRSTGRLSPSSNRQVRFSDESNVDRPGQGDRGRREESFPQRGGTFTRRGGFRGPRGLRKARSVLFQC